MNISGKVLLETAMWYSGNVKADRGLKGFKRQEDFT